MTVLLFALFWIVLAVALTAVALMGGRHKENPFRRGGRTWWYVGFAAALLVFGAAVPIAASLGAHENARDIEKAGIADLTEHQEDGREMFAKWCALCHTLEAANAVAEVGPNLDELRPTKALVLDAIENGRSRGNGAMAKDLVRGEDADKVAEFVSVAVGQGGK